MNQLIKYDAARHALQVAASVDEVISIKDKAEALRAYARQANDAQMQTWVVEIITRAIRRLGEVQNEMRQRGELAAHGGNRKNQDTNVCILKDTAVHPRLAAEATRFASVPPSKFEAAVERAKEDAKEVGKPLTLTAIRRELPQPKSFPPAERKIPDINDFSNHVCEWINNLLTAQDDAVLFEHMKQLLKHKNDMQPLYRKSMKNALTKLIERANTIKEQF